MPRPSLNKVGQRFGRLVVKALTAKRRHGQPLWMCLCDCGNQALVRAKHLSGGNVRSCGCIRREQQIGKVRRRWELHPGHGETKPTTLEYRTWAWMIQRCTNPNNSHWSAYGGRGITVCDRWRDYRNFLADMGRKPEGLTLERIDVNGNYEPSNCKWATWSEQNKNKRKRIGLEREVEELRAKA